MKKWTLTLLTMVSVLIAGCGGKVENESQGNSAVQSASAFEGLLVESKPANAVGIRTLKSGEHTDKEVIVTGRIGGRVKPFVEGQAMFMMADLGLQMCVVEGEHCATPWDACCVPADKIIADSITVQVKGDTGQIIQADLRGVSGLAPMAHVTVRGTVSDQNEQLLVLDAESIYLHAPGTID